MCNIRSGRNSPNCTVRKDSDTRSLIDLIKLFPDVPGRAERIRKFVALCYSYALWYEIDEGPNDGKPPDSATRRSKVHNEIMEIVQRLFQQADTAERIGGPMPDRVQVREMILAHRKKYQRKTISSDASRSE